MREMRIVEEEADAKTLVEKSKKENTFVSLENEDRTLTVEGAPGRRIEELMPNCREEEGSEKQKDLRRRNIREKLC